MGRLADYIRNRVISLVSGALSNTGDAVKDAERRVSNDDAYASLQVYLHAQRAGQLHAAMSIEAAVAELRGERVALIARGNRLAAELEALLADMAPPGHPALAQSLKEWQDIAP